MLYYDSIVVITQIDNYKVERLLLDEGIWSTILLANYFERIELPHNHIYEYSRNVYIFDGHNNYPIGCISLDVTLIGNVLIVDLLLMGYKSMYKAILRKDWTKPMEDVVSAKFQCIKHPHKGIIAKVCSNHW